MLSCVPAVVDMEADCKNTILTRLLQGRRLQQASDQGTIPGLVRTSSKSGALCSCQCLTMCTCNRNGSQDSAPHTIRTTVYQPQRMRC